MDTDFKINSIINFNSHFAFDYLAFIAIIMLMSFVLTKSFTDFGADKFDLLLYWDSDSPKSGPAAFSFIVSSIVLIKFVEKNYSFILIEIRETIIIAVSSLD